jgi:EAL domain-containing protein (putative c-di-GMP-specific phosphodiesterase class I)
MQLEVLGPRKVCFEITETAAIANLLEATALIHRLKDPDCPFLRDDCGSPMSSFTYLKHPPVDSLKIDGRFVKDMVEGPMSAMVEAINHIGRVMIETIAECIESGPSSRHEETYRCEFRAGIWPYKKGNIGPETSMRSL